jgi:hypothetical protein
VVAAVHERDFVGEGDFPTVADDLADLLDGAAERHLGIDNPLAAIAAVIDANDEVADVRDCHVVSPELRTWTCDPRSMSNP